MSFKYGKSSLEKLSTVNPFLKQIFKNVLRMKIMDITIIYGVRDAKEQNRLYKEGLSKLKWPESKHNIRQVFWKSRAIDAAPFIKGNVSYNYNHCAYLAGLVMGEAERMGIKLRWGGDWDKDGEAITDQSFNDLIHYELIMEA